MKTFKIDFNNPSGQEGDLCYYSRFGIDTYRSGCKHDCLYCYSRSQNKYQYKNWHPDDPSIIDTKWLQNQFYNAFETDRKATKITHILRQRVPIRIGMNGDPFNPLEQEYKATYEVLKTFQRYKYPYIIFTKNHLVADDKYISLYDPEISYFQMTVTTLNEELASKVEQNAPPPRDRISAMQKLSSYGFKTAFRINPLWPIYPDGYYSDDNNLKVDEPLKYFSWDLVDELCKANPHCIIAGFLRICTKIMCREIREKAGIDLKKYFIKKDRYFSDAEIEEYYKRIKQICDSRGTNFTVCYDSDENYEKFKFMWFNQNDCCGAKGMNPSFNKTALDAQ